MSEPTVVRSAARPAPVNPYAMLALGVLGMSFAALFSKLAAAPPLVIAAYRMGFTTMLLLPLAATTYRREILGFRRRDLLVAMVSGLFLALHFYTWITSLYHTSVASSTVLVTTQPFFVMIGSTLFLSERVPSRALGAGMLAFAGSALIGINDFRIGADALLGDLLALAGAVLIASYILIGRSLRQRYSLVAYTFVVYGSSALMLFLLGLAAGTPFGPYPIHSWIYFLLLAVVPTLCGHTIFNWALGYLKAPVVSISVLGEPVGATILALVFLGEVPAPLQVIGGVVIITGVYLFMIVCRQGE